MAMEKNPLMTSRVIVAFDATRDRNQLEFQRIVNEMMISEKKILHSGDTILVFGVLHRVLNPLGYQMPAIAESFTGTNIRAMEEEVSKKVDMYVKMLLKSAEDCKEEGVDIEVKVIAGTPIKKVIQQEATTCNATWVVLDRHLRRDLRFYVKQIPCKVALVLDNLTLDIVKFDNTTDTDITEHKLVLSMSKAVPLIAVQENEIVEQSIISDKSYSASITSSESFKMPMKNVVSSYVNRSRERSYSSTDDSMSREEISVGKHSRDESKFYDSPVIIEKQQKNPRRKRSSNTPVLCVACGMTTELYIKESMRFSYSEIQLSTDLFSEDKLLGEGGYGLVYKGVLNDGQIIAAKVQKEASTQGFSEFHSEVYVLSFACHKNIVMLLGYCCKENLNILVFEYICNKSLEWHLFENVLEWHQRHAIAIGTAKGLRFLHEECRSSPIIHQDLRPSNILLTHDFVPMLGDFGLAKWKMNDGPIQTRILGTLGYLESEYAENGLVSVRTDVYAFGIVLIQLMSGRKAVDSDREDRHQSLRQWAEPLIERFALHDLIDPRLGDSYDTYELYHMTKTAYLCMKIDPEKCPSMGEVVRLLEGESDHFQDLTQQFIPHFNK